MINIILLIIFNSLWIFGFHYCTLGPENPELLYFIRKLLEAKITNKQILKPLINCYVCMSSVHGLFIFSIFHSHFGINWWILPFYCFALAGLNRLIIWKLGE